MIKKNKISVIIPTYNRKEFLSEAVDSVLRQSFKNIEILIVDDGSTDGTQQYIENKYGEILNLKFYTNSTNSGAGVSRKNGYEKSNGEFVVFMDDDDYYTNPNFFDEALKILNEKSNISFVSSSSIIEYTKDKKREEKWMNISGEINNIQYLSSFQQKYMKSNSTFTTVFRRQSLEDANFKDVAMVNDSSIYLRALLTGNAYILDCISGVYRIHDKNITFNLSADFLNKNLLEKKKVKEEIEKRNLMNNVDEWLKNQYLLTTNYFEAHNKRKKVLIIPAPTDFDCNEILIKMILEEYPILKFEINYDEYKFENKYQNLEVKLNNNAENELNMADISLYDACICVCVDASKISKKVCKLAKTCKEKSIPFICIASTFEKKSFLNQFFNNKKNKDMDLINLELEKEVSKIKLEELIANLENKDEKIIKKILES